MKTVKNRKILLVIAMALVLSLSVGMTFAYFSGHTEAKGEAVVHLVGKTEIVEQVDENSKVIVIKNIGNTDVLVRVGVYAPAATEVTPAEGWTQKQGDFYYYEEILPVNGETSKIDVTIKGPVGEVENFDVVVVNECVPVTYNDDNTVVIPEGWPKGFLSN